MNLQRLCPCGTQTPYLFCCGAYIENDAIPDTPEALMRSRYTAYHDLKLDYIAATMKPPASLDFEPSASLEWAKTAKWVKLEVIASSESDNLGSVEFKAYYLQKGKQKHIHEISSFRRDDHRWYYISGVHPG